jgi:hypothetical protein
MPYHDRITRNLALFSPPGIEVTLLRTGRRRASFQITGVDLSFRMTIDRPEIFAFKENASQLKRLISGAYSLAGHC